MSVEVDTARGDPPLGRFITFEGGEGAGKSTQVRRLADRLDSRDIDVLATREPGGTPGGEAIRDLLVRGETDRWTPLAEALLNYAARQEHLERIIGPALAAGQWVISDRFADSTLAYQGMAGDVGRDAILTLDQMVVGNRKPDLTFILDVPVQHGLDRTIRRPDNEDRFERMDGLFHERLRQAFLIIAEEAPNRCVVIDGTGPVDDVAEAVWQAVTERFGAELERAAE